MADDIAGLIKALALEKPVLCGWSDGGQIALEMGIRHPQLVSGLVVGGAQMNPVSIDQSEFWASIGLTGAGEIDFDKFKKKMPDWYALLEDAHKSQGPEYWKIMIADLTRMWFDDSSYPGEKVQKINVPTLIFQMDRDEAIPMSEAIDLYENIPNAELAVIPGATHALSMGRRSSVFTCIVVDFIERLKQKN